MVKGYKVFRPNWKCKNKQYSCPGIFEEEIDLLICKRGMHFCKNAIDCFRYYRFNPKNHIAEVVAHGDVLENDNKCCTNKLEIVRELSWVEVLELVNVGKNCTGLGNTGNYNAGDSNTGDYNAGDSNTGDYNAGNFNTGWFNIGDYNAGNYNAGNYNAGNHNTGNHNTGNRNTGSDNTGDYNTGNWNIGDWNTASISIGCFNTIQQNILMFNKPTIYTLFDWLMSAERKYLKEIPKNNVEYIEAEYMSDEEKAAHPEYETTGGYLKVLDETESAQIWWDNAEDYKKQAIMKLPNFDAEIFEKCTGIRIKEDEKL